MSCKNNGRGRQTKNRSPGWGLWWLRMVCVAVTAALGLGLLSSGAGAAREQEGKAAIIYNIAKFVEWPPGAWPGQAAPLVLGMAESDPMADGFGILIGRSLHGRRLVINKITRKDEFRKCQMVFFSAAAQKTAAAVLTNLTGLPILTITDGARNFTRGRAIINLISEAGQIKFQINLRAARHSGLKLSSQLLKLAEVVEGDEK